MEAKILRVAQGTLRDAFGKKRVENSIISLIKTKNTAKTLRKHVRAFKLVELVR